MGDTRYEFSSDNREHCGELVTLHLGQPIVVLNSAEAVKEAFIKNANNTSERDRFNPPLYHITKGIITKIATTTVHITT